MTKFTARVALSFVFAACGSGGGGGHVDGSSTPVAPANGKSTIEFGVPVKGTVDTSDRHYYVIGPPTVSGYEDVYQIEVTAGTTYAVTCTGDITIQDADSGGEFTAQGGTLSADMTCYDSPATWSPRRAGAVTINILAAADEVPLSYTMTFSK